MAETAIPDYPRGLTFEDVWAGLMENRIQMEETDRRLKETERLIKRNGRQIGGLHRRFGELAEHMVAPGIVKRFNELGYHFHSVAPGGIRILDESGKVKTEVDLLLENDEYMVAVEVKTRPVEHDIEHHMRRLEILREHRNMHHDSRKIQGAIAGAVFPQEVKKLSLDAGLYVIEQSGDTMQIDIPDGFIPREW